MEPKQHPLGLGNKLGEGEPGFFSGSASLFSVAGFKRLFSNATKEGFSIV